MTARCPKSSYNTLKADLSILPLFSGIPAREEDFGAPPPGGGAPDGVRGVSGGGAPPLKSNTTHSTYPVENDEYTSLNFRGYSDGLSEATWARPRKPSGRPRAARGASLFPDRNRENVIKRAKTAIRRKCMHNKLDYLVTLTPRENITDRARFGALVSEFQRRVKLRFPEWDCITVLEKQERGAWHAHLGVHGWQKLQFQRKTWWAVVGDYEGHHGGAVNVNPPPGKRVGQHLRWDIVALANYLCKYISKAVGEDHIFDKKTYWHTRGIDFPPVETILVASGAEEYWAGYLVNFIPGRRKHTWTDYNGAIGRVANY